VPGAVCGTGPYRYVRHPFYSSYMVAFLAVAVAFPSLIVVGVCVLNMGLFVYMWRWMMREGLLVRPLGASYLAYQGGWGCLCHVLGDGR
jgi:protein-S-isoprenylcysteine O-methyltransferase Ste14